MAESSDAVSGRMCSSGKNDSKYDFTGRIEHTDIEEWIKHNHISVGSLTQKGRVDHDLTDRDSPLESQKTEDMQKKVNNLATKLTRNVQRMTTQHKVKLEHINYPETVNIDAEQVRKKAFKELLEQFEVADAAHKQKLRNIKEDVYSLLQDNHEEPIKISELQEELAVRDRQLCQLRKKHDGLKTRLSKMNTGNLDINFLSKENSPTMLAERFGELYDNQWGEAFEEIQGSLGGRYDMDNIERDVTFILLQILKESWQFCEAEFQAQEIRLKKTLLMGAENNMELPEESLYHLKQARKFVADKTVDAVCQRCLARNSSLKGFPTEKTKSFLNECVRISWLMINQNPPIVFDVTAKPGDSFDLRKYKAYTKKGSKIDFVVWPPMQMQGHSLLNMGIAQGTDECVKETTNMHRMKTAVTSKFKLQTGTRIYTSDDDKNPVTYTAEFGIYQSEKMEGWNVAYEEKDDAQDCENWVQRTTTQRAARADPLTTKHIALGEDTEASTATHQLARKTNMKMRDKHVPK